MIVEYLILACIVLGMNVIPGFMPPTWTVLAFFVTKYDLQLLPVVLIGATLATTGRIILATGAGYFRKFLSKKSQENYGSLGQYFNTHQSLTIPLVITYAFIPIPSNHVFIAAGLAKVNIKLLAGSFFVGRLISYTFWVNLTQRLADNLEGIFSSHYSKIGTIGAEIIGVLIILLIGKIAWKKVLHNLTKA